MKKLLIIIFCLITQYSVGQKKLKAIEERISSDGVSYKVSRNISHPNGRKMYSNTLNKLDNDLAIIPRDVSKYAFSSIDMGNDEAKRRDALIKKAYESKSRQIPDDTIMITYKMTLQGKILELNFWLKGASLISVDDISLIENTLKKEYTVKLDAKQFKGMKYVWYSAPMFLSKLKDL